MPYYTILRYAILYNTTIYSTTSLKVAGSIPMGSSDFSFTYSFRPQYGPGVDSVSITNEYQEYFLWGKGGR